MSAEFMCFATIAAPGKAAEGDALRAADGQPLDASSGPVAWRGTRRRLTAADAVDIWIARWLRIRTKDLLARYDCDSRRLYEIWWEQKFTGSRDRAMELFRARYPGLAERTDYGYKRQPRGMADRDLQPSLFDPF